LRRVIDFFFRRENPPLTVEDRAIVEILARRPLSAKEIIERTGIKRRTLFDRLRVLRELGYVEKRGELYYGSWVTEFEARSSLLFLASVVALIYGALQGNLALVGFSIFCMFFASGRRVRYKT
jgi:DNA-binding transcriptional ArsR family regulator